jgi:hypothetical protein
MKIYCVVDNVDLGYHVEYASISKDKANEVLLTKLQEERQKFYVSYEMIEIEVEE